MDKQMRILDLLNQKQIKQYELEKMIYGSIEIRDKDNSKYIYTHTKEEGIQSTQDSRQKYLQGLVSTTTN